MKRARTVHATTTTETRPEGDAQPRGDDDPIDSLLERVEQPAPTHTPAAAAPALRTARVLSLQGRAAKIAWRGRGDPIDAELAPELDRELVAAAIEDKATVLVEVAPDAAPLLVGVLQTRLPRELKLKAGTVTIEGEQEVLIRSGRAALRLREDGDIEIVGSRISASSRGLFRLVGRILRLN